MRILLVLISIGRYHIKKKKFKAELKIANVFDFVFTRNMYSFKNIYKFAMIKIYTEYFDVNVQLKYIYIFI